MKLEDEPKLNGSLSDLCKHATLRTNLIVMAVIWSFGSFAFFFVPYYLNKMKANIYYLSLATELAEFLASVVCVFITRIIDLRKALLICCMIVCLGSVTMIFVTGNDDSDKMSDNLLPAGLIMLTNMAVVVAFDVAYLVNAELFPTIVLATAYGVCNVFSRMISISSPIVASGIIPPYPLIILAVFAFFSGSLSLLLRRQ